MKRVLGLSIFAVLMSSSVFAYECKDSIEPTTRAEQFLDNGDGTITDLRFGLMWQMCTYGQHFDSETKVCKGDASAVNTWSAAILSQDAINGDSQQGYGDWRLPSIKELQSIVERQCRQPAIKLSLFNGTSNAAYWSNTPDGSVNTTAIGRLIDFSDGVEVLRATNTQRFVRHVRSISQ